MSDVVPPEAAVRWEYGWQRYPERGGQPGSITEGPFADVARAVRSGARYDPESGCVVRRQVSEWTRAYALVAYRMNVRPEQHWLLFTGRRVTGCHCGFLAAESDEGYGDSVVRHLMDVARADLEDALDGREDRP